MDTNPDPQNLQALPDALNSEVREASVRIKRTEFHPRLVSFGRDVHQLGARMNRYLLNPDSIKVRLKPLWHDCKLTV